MGGRTHVVHLVGGGGVRVKVGAGSLGGFGGRGSSPLSPVLFLSSARYVVCAAAPRVSSIHVLYSSCAQRILGGVVSDVGLWLGVCALGFGMLSKVLVGLGVGASVLGDADSYVELEALRLWFLLSGVLFCSRFRLALLSFTAQIISCSWRVSLIVSSSRAGRSNTLYALGFGVLSSVLIMLGVEAGVFADAGYIWSAGGGDNVWMLLRVRKYRSPSCSITIHRSLSVCDTIWPLRPLS